MVDASATPKDGTEVPPFTIGESRGTGNGNKAPDVGDDIVASVDRVTSRWDVARCDTPPVDGELLAALYPDGVFTADCTYVFTPYLNQRPLRRPPPSSGAASRRRSGPVPYDALVRTIGNILWLILAGIWLAIGYVVAGLVTCLTIIGIPFGIQAFKLALFSLWPFGRTVLRQQQGGVLEVVFNVIWLVLFGWPIFLAHIVAGFLLCITIIGIPFGIQAFKLSVLALWPFGRSIVDADDLAAGPGAIAVPTDLTAR